jgi:hypothetical protein
MKPIEVFYHVFIPKDERASMWTWWIDQQLGLIKSSKLADIATVNIAVTAPKFWEAINGITFRENGTKNDGWNFGQKIQEYISTRYPFVNILDIRDISANNYEGNTLKLLYDRCQIVDADILYIHSKGVISASPSVAAWREILNHYCINEWPRCIKMLETSDVVGIKDLKSQDFTVSGNFWWSKSSHIRTLYDPLDTSRYVEDPMLHPGAPAYRYGFEYWILHNQPTVNYIIDTETDHFDRYCFLEDLLKKDIK